jgi:hypothetical protein
MNNHEGCLPGETQVFRDTNCLKVGRYYAILQCTRVSYKYIGNVKWTTRYSNDSWEKIGLYKGKRGLSVYNIYLAFEENGMERVIESPRYPDNISFIEAEPPLIYSYVLK